MPHRGTSTEFGEKNRSGTHVRVLSVFYLARIAESHVVESNPLCRVHNRSAWVDGGVLGIDAQSPPRCDIELAGLDSGGGRYHRHGVPSRICRWTPQASSTRASLRSEVPEHPQKPGPCRISDDTNLLLSSGADFPNRLWRPTMRLGAAFCPDERRC